MAEGNDADGGTQAPKLKKKNNSSGNSFKGDAVDMRGHVFQLPHESGNY